jgi:putative transcriptional regulator
MMPRTPRAVDVRKRFGLSQPRFAKLLDVGVRTICAWEQGLKTPSGPARALLRILDNLGPKASLRALGVESTKRRG